MSDLEATEGPTPEPTHEATEGPTPEPTHEAETEAVSLLPRRGGFYRFVFGPGGQQHTGTVVALHLSQSGEPCVVALDDGQQLVWQSLVSYQLLKLGA